MTRRELGTFVARRLAGLVVVLLAISFAVFALLYVAPGDTARILLGPHPASPAALRAVRETYHLNHSFVAQYLIWLGNAVHFDFGTSVQSGLPVSQAIGDRIGLTLQLGVFGFVVAMLLGVPLGVLAAVRQRTVVDRGVVGLSVIGVSAPAFVTALFLLYVFAVQLAWFPVSGSGQGLGDRFWHLTLPAAALALTAMALVVKFTRAGMVRALEQDFIGFARARGVAPRRILLAYALRNALIPVITAGGLLLGTMLTGAVLVEIAFALPGVGSLLVDSVNRKDIPVVQGVTMVFALLIVLVNAGTDLLYRLVDPRVRFEAVRS